MQIHEIDWGADSAENDPNLLQYFQDSIAFQRISARQKQLVVGRKGAGKSALREKLIKYFSAEPNTHVINIAPTFNSIRSVLNDESLQRSYGKEIFFEHTWLRQILLDCLSVVGHSVKGKYANESMSFAREVSVELNRTSKDLVENISEILTRVKAKVGDLGEFGLELEKQLRSIADVDALEHHTVEITKQGAKFVILIDDLDQGWDNSNLANGMLLGLLRAAFGLHGRVNAIFPIVFMREDVYSLLMPLTQHADKYRNIESIVWEKTQLIAILNARINFNRRQKGLGALDDPYGQVFPDAVGTSHADNWMIERTLSRPRELLQLARLYTQNVVGNNPDDAVLKQSEITYSTWKLADLCSEFSNQYPGIADFFQAWRANYYRRPYHLRRADVDGIILHLMTVATINQPWFNQLVDDTNVSRMIEILYEMGLLGDYIAGGAGGGARTFYSYMGPHQPRFDEVQVHPCFRRALDTVERIRS
ncbi:P-loop ATPase, Sll1717 family [Xanthomonas translucens]|uniref:P-loop ATPase, Sll1717 family n=1 Tax=Xanthomonas campestris pv. translucens TaxID=343 RepID=UPI000B20FC15|nr:hypothetical protein [Xanthomonas translucens]MCT8271654.1 hypothetical protein [Xanthomonas translucens pv. undulosa]WNJ32442.1 hypothetical protein RMA82_08840 [Xanthomonas translucens pv. undulosa]